MANRLTIPVVNFESLPPPWNLVSLDADMTAIQTALNDSSLGYSNAAVDTGAANAYAITLPFGSPSSYQSGMVAIFKAANSNTGASTLTVSPLGAIQILNQFGNPLQSGDILAGQVVYCIYLSPNFYMLSQSVSALPTQISQFYVTPGVGLQVQIGIPAPQLLLGNTNHFNAGSSTPGTLFRLQRLEPIRATARFTTTPMQELSAS
jgi:hypothetical protein